MIQEERDKEFDSLLEDRHSQTLRIAKNLAQIVQPNKRQEAKTVREIVLYYFDATTIKKYRPLFFF